MPNHKLSGVLQEQINKRAAQLTARRVAYAESAFPLSVEQLQHAIVKAEDVATLKRLKSGGMDSLPEQKHLNLFADIPGLTRRAGLFITTPVEVFYPRYMSTTGYGGVLDLDHARSDCVKLGTDHLEPDTIAALVKWVNDAVREHRLAEMTTYLVRRMLGNHIPTTGHLLARWPVLALLVQDKQWKSRLQHPPVRTNAYRWDPQTQPDEATFKLLAAAEVVLTSASIMEDFTRDVSQPIAGVATWERLKNDRSF